MNKVVSLLLLNCLISLPAFSQYNSSQPRKCIWGDYRLPFTFDFDQGDGEMRVNEKYEANGWENFYQPDKVKWWE